MRILIATDAWRPQVNGVLHTLEANAQAAKALGAEVVFLNPEGFPSVSMPSYPGIRLALPRRREIFRRIADIGPDAIHIATEGPIGHFARWYCMTNRRPFTTSFHTRFTDYAAARFPVPEGWTWAWLRWFHNAGRGTMVSTASLAQELRMQGFRTVLRWPRGVDFPPVPSRSRPRPRPAAPGVSHGGPPRGRKECRGVPRARPAGQQGRGRRRTGARHAGAAVSERRLPRHQARRRTRIDLCRAPMSSCFRAAPTPSASCCWRRSPAALPIAGFPVAATRDVVGTAPVAALDDDLRAACLKALTISRAACRRYAETVTWEESARCFIGNLVRMPNVAVEIASKSAPAPARAGGMRPGIARASTPAPCKSAACGRGSGAEPRTSMASTQACTPAGAVIKLTSAPVPNLSVVDFDQSRGAWLDVGHPKAAASHRLNQAVRRNRAFSSEGLLEIMFTWRSKGWSIRRSGRTPRSTWRRWR